MNEGDSGGKNRVMSAKSKILHTIILSSQDDKM